MTYLMCNFNLEFFLINMRKRVSINEPEVINNQMLRASDRFVHNESDEARLRPFMEILAGEGNEDLLNYIEWLGLDFDPDPVILSSLHHYYYDAEEMKNVKTLVNLIRLNQIKEIKDFLYSVSHILSPKCNLIGCFVDSKKNNPFVLRKNVSGIESEKMATALENGIISRVPLLNRIYSFIDLRTNKYLTKKNVTLLLEDHGFKILDMTDINGLTYYHVKRRPETVKNQL